MLGCLVEIEIAESSTSQAANSEENQSLQNNSATTIKLSELLPNYKENSILKRLEATGEDFHQIRLQPTSELIENVTIERKGDRIKINLEMQEFIRRLKEEIDIRVALLERDATQ